MLKRQQKGYECDGKNRKEEVLRNLTLSIM